MATVPALSERTVVRIRDIEARAHELTEIAAMLIKLPEPWSKLDEARMAKCAMYAKQGDDDAVAMIKLIESETDDMRKRTYAAWQAVTHFISHHKAGPERARGAFRLILSQFTMRERRKAELARREGEQRQLAAAEADRAAAVAHLKSVAATASNEDRAAIEAEIAARQTAPLELEPVLVLGPMRVEGWSTSTKRSAQIVNAHTFLKWLTETPERCEAIAGELWTWKQSGLGAMVKRMGGNDEEWATRGVQVTKIATGANRKRSE